MINKHIVALLIMDAVIFYLGPLFIVDTASAMMLLLILFPFVVIVFSFLNALYNSSCLYAVLIMLIFAPTVWLYYNESATVYIWIYGALSLISGGLAKLWKLFCSKYKRAS